MVRFLKEFLKYESTGGILLMTAAVVAMMAANSPIGGYYGLAARILTVPINDALMVVFFLLIGLEIKREIIEGELSTWSQALLPLIAAIGGVVLPAVIYGYFNWGTETMRGWAIPSATDIAFSLGVLMLLGNRVPTSLKIFLMALAVIDDVIAIIIIAVFYTDHLSIPALAMAAGCSLALWKIAQAGVRSIWVYMLVGLALWLAVFLSGVHVTIAGVILGLMIPLKPVAEGEESLCKTLIHRLHPWVAFGIMPLFALANAGIPLAHITHEQWTHPVTLGIALGLLLGKQLGIILVSWLVIRLGYARLPSDANWLQFYAISLLAGIGFTMSLFIGSLAFADPILQMLTRMGVMVGSLVSAVCGYGLMFFAVRTTLRQT